MDQDGLLRARSICERIQAGEYKLALPFQGEQLQPLDNQNKVFLSKYSWK